jgi:ribosomal protein S6--L-glutamate ligase
MSASPTDRDPKKINRPVSPSNSLPESSTHPDKISLGKRLRKSSIPCIGICPNWSDYPDEMKRRLTTAGKICYPGPVYEEIFLATGSNIFPKNYYAFMGNKIAQTDLFQLLEIPHPRTRVYYGRTKSERICKDFRFPFLGKTPLGSSRGEGVFLICGPAELSEYLKRHNPAYIQEYLPIERDLRVVVIGGEVIHAYWRIHKEGDFRNNVARGGSISFDEIPEPALAFARNVAAACGFDEVGLDICEQKEKYYILEANMVFGIEGFRKKDMDIHEIIANLFDTGR